MAINFHLASGASHPWLIPKSGFDETVDLDSLLPMIQLVLVAFAGRLLYERRKVQSSITNRGTGTDARPTAPPG